MSLSQYIHRPPRPGSVVESTFSIPLTSLSPKELENEQKNLTLQARGGFGVSPPPFQAYCIKDGRLHVPRFYGYERFGEPEEDLRCFGAEVNFEFVGTLKQVQRDAVDIFMKRAYAPGKKQGGVSVMPCGTGKTVFGLYMTSMLKSRTLVVVHTTALFDQWEERIGQFLPSARIGKIRGDLFDVEEKDIIIAMVMTLAKRKYENDAIKSIGFVILDESHHLAAPFFNSVFSCLPSARFLALTATLERPDGLTPLLHWCIGPELFRIQREQSPAKVSCVLYNPKSITEIKYKDGQIALSLMITKLCRDKERNLIIANNMVRYWRAGRVIILLTDRTDQISYLSTLLQTRSVPASEIGVMKAGQKKEDRQAALACNILMCTFGMANEGLDKTCLDTLILASPKKRITQAVGRIQRSHEGKQIPLVLDIVDNFSVFANQRWARWKVYTEQGFECQTVHSTVEPKHMFE